MKQFLFVFLLCSLLLKNLPMLFAEECRKNEVSVDGTIENQASPSQGLEEQSVIFAQSQPVFSPEVENLIQGTELSHAAGLPDPNESVEALSAFLEEMKRVKQSIKKRMFGDEINTEGLEIDKWLTKGEKNLLKLKEKYPESRHIYEGLARIYQELYEYTKDISYLEKASNSFIQAEELGIRYGNIKMSHYVEDVAEIFTILRDIGKLDNFFLEVIRAYPNDHLAYLYYAIARANIIISDKERKEFKKIEDLFQKAIQLRPDGNFDSVIKYAEWLLDNKMFDKSLNVLNYYLKLSEEPAFYPHFLKGFALEKLNLFDEAQKEYSEFLKFKDLPRNSVNESERDIYFLFEPFIRPPLKYKIVNSHLQTDIRFKGDKELISTMDLRTTPCSPDDWICKAYYYLLWTIEGEARNGTIGMYRAVGWNIRTRVFNGTGTIACPGTYGICFNYASKYPLVYGDVNSLARRYFYVIETGEYAGLLRGKDNTQTAVTAERALIDVVYASVPDPIAGGCLYGYQSGDFCNGTCSTTSLWGSFWAYQSGVEFRAGVLRDWYDWGIQCYKFEPISTPNNPMYCWKNCFTYKGPICPVMSYGTKPCWSDARGSYYYSGPIYGNIFWRFNQ